MKMFLCDWIEGVCPDGEMGRGSYVTFNYLLDGPIGVMRFNRKSCLIAVLDDNVPAGFATDPNVSEWNWESEIPLSIDTITVMTDKLGFEAEKLNESISGRELTEKYIKRQTPFFDLAGAEFRLKNNMNFYIDLTNSEMDL